MHCLVIALRLAVLCTDPSIAQPGDQANKPTQVQELPAELVAAWKKAGAKVGWMTNDMFFGEGAVGQKGDVPAFYFQVWTPGVVVNLPQPQTAFGLDLGGQLKLSDKFAGRNVTVTDAAVKELVGLKNLQSLNLGLTNVTDEGLKELVGLKNLQSLNIGCLTKVTDAGLKELASLKSLQLLNLHGAGITNAGLKELAGLKSLQSLDLTGTLITDAGLKELAALKSLQWLNLDFARDVTDVGVKELASLKSLRWLNLDFTQVSDAGLKELAVLKSLQKLSLERTKVTKAGVAELQTALPKLKIAW